MKRQVVTGLLGLEILITLGAGILTGCTEKNVDYSIDSIRGESQIEENSEKGGKRGLTQFAGESQWNDMWEANSGRTIKVKADILVQETEQMSVVEVEVPEFNAEQKERIVKSLFDDETVYYHDEEHLTKRELQEWYDWYKEYYDAATDSDLHLYWQTEVERLEAAMENAKDVYTPADEYETNEYIGKYGGVEYILRIDDNESNGHYGTTIDFYVNDISAICPKEGYADYMEYRDTDIVENECRLSATEAEKQAVEFIEKLGLEYPVLSDTKPIIWKKDNEFFGYSDGIVNGYVFHFGYGLDGVSFSGFGSDEEYYSDLNSNVTGLPESNETQYCTRAELRIYVTEQGIIAMAAHAPVMTAGITGVEKLLSLDEIKDIMKEQITENYEEFHFNEPTGGKTLEFTHMELIYFRVTDNKNPGHYSYIPVWRLSKQTGNRYGRYINNPVIVNAIDGSVIKLQTR